MADYQRKLKCEIWKDIHGYEGLYQVSNRGNVRSITHYARNNQDGGARLTQGIMLRPYATPNGYLQVTLSNGKWHKKKRYVHRLVANAFLINSDNLSDVNHIDGNKRNNSVNNLEWCTHQRNAKHAVQNRLTRKAKPVFCEELNREFNSMTEAGINTGTDRHSIKKACDTGEPHNGYHWRLIWAD